MSSDMFNTRCELCGEYACVRATCEVRGNEIHGAFCDKCNSKPEARALMDEKCRNAQPTEKYLRDQAKPRLYVVMEKDVPDYHGSPESDVPIAIFIDETRAANHIERLRDSGYIRTDWYLAEVPLEDGDIT